LVDVLVVEEQDLVSAEIVTAVLASIAVTGAGARSDGPAPAVTAAAQFSYGVHLGAHPKPAPEYIGATNRAQRRKVRLATCDALIAERRRERDATAAKLTQTNDLLTSFGAAREELPQAAPIVTAADRVKHQSSLLAAARDALREQRHAFDVATAELDARRRRLRQTAADRNMPARAADVDAVARAVEDFAAAAQAVHGSRELAANTERDLRSRRQAIERLRAQHDQDAAALHAKKREHAIAVADLAAREEALAAPLKELLGQIEEVERCLETTANVRREYAAAATREHDAVIRAENDLKHGQESLSEAVGHLFEHAASFAPYAHIDLRTLLGVGIDARWPADPGWPTTDEATKTVTQSLAGATADPVAAVRAALPGGVIALIDAFQKEFTELRPVSDSALKNAASQMSAALREFQDALDGCAEDYRLDHDPTGVVMVYVRDEGGRSPVAAFARRIKDRVEEQGVLLEERERAVLEDELLSGLAQQIHDRVRTARDLVTGMNRDTRAKPMSSGTRIGIRWGRSDKMNDKQRAIAQHSTWTRKDWAPAVWPSCAACFGS
jgi:hypothetical protein